MKYVRIGAMIFLAVASLPLLVILVGCIVIITGFGMVLGVDKNDKEIR